MKRIVHIQHWGEHILVTPTYDLPRFRQMVTKSLWMAQPQYLREMQTWAFDRLYSRIVDNAMSAFFLCEECTKVETVRCGLWIDYVLDEYAKTTGITFGRKKEQTLSASEAARALGIKGAVTPASIQQAFRTAVLKAHPDLGGSAEAVRKVIDARDTLLEALEKAR